MTLKKHRESVFKSFRENKKEIKRAEKDIKWKEWFNSPEQVEGRRQMKKHTEWAAICRLGGIGDYCAKYDKPEMLEAHRQLHSLQWEQENPRQRNMKAILEFNLPEEEEQFDVATKAMDWALLAWDIDQFMRNKIKYDQDRDGILQLVRDRLNFNMEEKGLQYPE